MTPSLVVLTGASGAGKTTLAHAVQQQNPRCEVYCFDSIGVPSAEIMASFGSGHQPGGAWQRAMTLEWFQTIARTLDAGRSVLFEGQMRIAFIQEAVAEFGILQARVILVDCDEATRTARLTHDRHQPGLADASMMAWSRYLRSEAVEAGCEILDTGKLSIAQSVDRLVSYLVD